MINDNPPLPVLLPNSARHIVVIGDVMLDRFLYGVIERISPEAPVPILRRTHTRSMLGGAGNVARNITSLGVRAVLMGMRGKDTAGAEVANLIEAQDNLVDQMIESSTYATICKTRLIAGTQQIARIDEEVIAPLQAAEKAAILRTFDMALADCGVVILSDYAKGLLDRPLLAAMIEAAALRNIPVLADPKNDDFRLYAGTTLLTPNARELAQATSLPTGTETEIIAACRLVMDQTGIFAVLCTRAEKGMILVQSTGDFLTIPAQAREVFDVSGAGDTVIATLAVMLSAGHSIVSAVHSANMAAGIVVGKLGTATVTQQELAYALQSAGRSDPIRDQMLGLTAIMQLVQEWRAQGLRIGFANGCFDILHAGHVTLLTEAKRRCDRLIVALNTDDSITRLKGPSRPINTLKDRAAVIAALGPVDAVVAFAEDTPLELISCLKPDILIKGTDYTPQSVIGADVIRAEGGEVVLVNLLPERSTSAVIARASLGQHAMQAGE